MKIGILSDTHGRLPSRVLDLFDDVDLIFHAGDIGSLEVIEALESLAPVHAVSGNMDGGTISRRFPRKDMIEAGKMCFYLVHEPYNIDIDPVAASVNCVIFGHTHQVTIEEKGSVLFLNPGSVCLPRRGPATVIKCLLSGNRLKPEIMTL